MESYLVFFSSIVCPDLPLGILGIVLGIPDLVGVTSSLRREMHGSVTLLDQVDAQVGVIYEQVANEVAGLIHVLHLDLNLKMLKVRHLIGQHINQCSDWSSPLSEAASP